MSDNKPAVTLLNIKPIPFTLKTNALLNKIKKECVVVFDGEKNLVWDCEKDRLMPLRSDQMPLYGCACEGCQEFSNSWKLYDVDKKVLCIRCALKHYEEKENEENTIREK